VRICVARPGKEGRGTVTTDGERPWARVPYTAKWIGRHDYLDLTETSGILQAGDKEFPFRILFKPTRRNVESRALLELRYGGAVLQKMIVGKCMSRVTRRHA
jgi:hypothetical protein